MNYTEAKTQCKSDGALLALPKSNSENKFIADLIPNEHIWIGLDDIEEEGKFVASDGHNVSYTKWYTLNNEPNNYNDNEDGVHIIGDHWVGHTVAGSDSHGFWNDQRIDAEHKFVCFYSVLRSKASSFLFQVFDFEQSIIYFSFLPMLICKFQM